MHVIAEQTADEMWQAAARLLLDPTQAVLQSSRAGDTFEALHVVFELQRPSQRWITSRSPAMNPAFALVEAFWIAAGRRDSGLPTYWNPALSRYCGSGKSYHGAYGHRIRHHLGIDQLDRAYSALRSNPDSRQCVLQIWDSAVDLPSADGTPSNQDIPCNLLSIPKVRNGKLEWMQIIRSNDLFLGLPHNIVQFTVLQEMLSGWLGLELYPGLMQVPGIAEDQGEIATAKRLEQFENIVRWWQYTSIPRGPLDHPAFTHGDRIRRYGGHLDQIAGIIDALAREAKTSRGIAVLLHPPADRISDPDVQFPSFCLVQFKIQENEREPPSLDCTAYFRKQEVRYWWLVNLAELAKLQREICDALGQRTNAPEVKGIRPGGITTIAARAHAGDSAPKVQIPLIDRSYSLERERLFGMVNSLVWDSMPNREDYAEEWLQMFFELHPPEKPDPDGVAVAQVGIEYLKDEIDKHLKASSAGDTSLGELHRALEQLLNANRDFALAQRKQEATSERYKSWRGTVKPLIERVIELSYGRITALKLNNK